MIDNLSQVVVDYLVLMEEGHRCEEQFDRDLAKQNYLYIHKKRKKR